MRRIRNQTEKVVWHCSATPPDWNGHAADIDRMHKDRGWDGIGYHVVISREGLVAWGENPRRQGAHAKGHNHNTIAVVMVGGVDKDGKAENNFTPEQWEAARATFLFLSYAYPDAEHVGHRDLSEDRDGDGRIQRHEFMKDCPCFSVKQWLENDLKPVKDLYAPWEENVEEDIPVLIPEDLEELQDEYIGDEDEGWEDDGDETSR